MTLLMDALRRIEHTQRLSRTGTKENFELEATSKEPQSPGALPEEQSLSLEDESPNYNST